MPVRPEASRNFELEEARKLQRAMVPLEPLCEHPFEIACRFHPVKEVGGDFLDYFVLPDRRLDFYMGDVTGKGLPAALYAALAVGTLRGFNKRGESPGAILERFNQRLLLYTMPGRFCAAGYGVIDPETRILTLGNAGLPLPLHIQSADCRPIGAGGLPAGILHGASYEQHTIQLEPGELLLFYTDGLTEAVNKDREEFGAARLVQVCEQNNNRSAADLLRAVFKAVNNFAGDAPQHDDMTAVAVKLC